MIKFSTRSAVAVGEAMIEMAPVSDGLYRRGFAGDTFNTAWHMKQLLGDGVPVGFFTRIGTDRLSDAFAAELAADGLDASIIARDPLRTIGLYMIELDGAERSFHYWRGQSAARQLADDPDALDAALRGAGLIHLSGITLAILSTAARVSLFAALARARGTGSVIAFDPNIRRRLWSSPEELRTVMLAMLRITDIAVPSFDDEKALWGDRSPEDTIGRIGALGASEVVVKDGSRPVFLLAGGRRGVHETAPVSCIRDTTGAGDAFNAGYLAGRLLARTPAQAVGIGHRLAAEVIQCFGARAPKDKVVGLVDFPAPRPDAGD